MTSTLLSPWVRATVDVNADVNADINADVNADANADDGDFDAGADGARTPAMEQKRQRILAAARALFAKHGPDGTTTRAVAKRARVAHGTLFRYAETKADLVAMVFAADIGAAVDDAVRAPPRESFVAFAMHFFTAFIDVYGRDPALARALVKELPWLEGRSRAAMMEPTHTLLGALAAYVKGGRGGVYVDDVNVAVAASAAFSLYFGTLAAWLSGEFGDPRGEGKSTALALLREGLSLLEKGMSR